MSKNKIKAKNNYAPIFQDSSFVNNYINYDLMMNISKLLKANKVDEANELLSSLSKSIAGHHPLYPYFSTGIENRSGKLTLVSKPNSEEAIKIYPPRYKGKMTLPEKYRGFTSIDELLDYSYRNQEDIEVNVQEIRKLLGDFDDPYQDELFSPENLKKMKFKIKHREFPQATPFKIVFANNNFSLDYILLSGEKITENNEIILSNKEQDIGLCITLFIDFTSKRLDFNIRVKEDYIRDVSTCLAFTNFMLNGKKDNKLEIISLEENRVFISGYLNDVNYESRFGDGEKEKEFLEHLKIIEDFYDIKINLADEITKDDVINAEILARAITGKEIKGNYNSLDTEIRLVEETKDTVKNFYNEGFALTYEMYDYEIKVFDKSFKIPKIIKTMGTVKIENLEKVIKKIDVLETGDLIKIKFIPVDKKTIEYTDEFFFDEE